MNPTQDNAMPPHLPTMPARFFFIASGVFAAIFMVWSILVVNAPAIQSFDDACAKHWQEWSDSYPRWSKPMIFFTDIGSVAAMALLVVMGAIWQTSVNNRFLAMAWIGVVIGGALLNLVAKESFDRPRPPESMRHRAVLETNVSYPSGHAMGSAIGYGMLGYALVLPQRHRPRRIAILFLMTGMFLMVGFSRIYLRAHWFSDVIAGWTIGLAWLFLCVGLIERHRQRVA